MRTFIFSKCIALILLMALPEALYSQDGKQLFRVNCAACHAMGRQMVGPDLTDIHRIREHDWLISFIVSSQQMIRDGDELAIEVFEKANRIPMPDFKHLEGEEIQAILDYIKTYSTPETTQKVEEKTPGIQAEEAVAGSMEEGTPELIEAPAGNITQKEEDKEALATPAVTEERKSYEPLTYKKTPLDEGRTFALYLVVFFIILYTVAVVAFRYNNKPS